MAAKFLWSLIFSNHTKWNSSQIITWSSNFWNWKPKIENFEKVDIEGHAAYHSHEDDSSQTQRIILKITKKAGVAETQQSDIEEIKKRKADSFQSKFNQAASHVVSQIEYGSSVFIELIHTGIVTLKSPERNLQREFFKISLNIHRTNHFIKRKWLNHNVIYLVTWKYQ